MARLTPKDAAGLMDAYRKVHTPPPTPEEPKTDDPRPTEGDGGDVGEPAKPSES